MDRMNRNNHYANNNHYTNHLAAKLKEANAQLDQINFTNKGIEQASGFAKAITANLIGHGSEVEIEAFWKAAHYYGSLYPHELIITRNLIKQLTGKSHLAESELTKKCEELSEHARNIQKMPIVGKIRQLEIDDKKGTEIIRKAGHEVYKPDGKQLTLVAANFLDIVRIAPSNLATYDAKGHFIVVEIHQQLEQLVDPVREAFASTYMDQIKSSDEGILTLEHTILQFLKESDRIGRVRGVMRTLHPSYKAVSDMRQNRYAIRMINEYGNGEQAKKIHIFGPMIAGLEKSGVDIKSLESLLARTKAYQKEDDFEGLLIFAQENMQFVNASRNIWRNPDIEPKAILPFIQDYFKLPTSITNITVGQAVESVLGSVGTAVHVLIENALVWRTDVNLPEILNIAKSNALAGVLLRDYFAYGTTSETKKQKFILALANYSKDSLVIKNARQIIRDIDNDSLPDQFAEMSVDSILKSLKTTPKVNAPRIKKPTLSWIDVAAGNNGAVLRETYDLLNSVNLDQRLKYVFNNHPREIELFCTHVKMLHGASAVQSVLGDSYLFASYVSRLNDTTLTADISQAITTGGNSYKAVRRIFIPQKILFTVSASETETLVDEVNIAEGYKRIVVIGGRFSNERQRNLEATSPLPVVFFDYNLRHKQNIGSVRPTDVVVFDITSLDHSTYYAIKAHCKKNEIPFTESGRNRVVDAARSVLATK